MSTETKTVCEAFAWVGQPFTRCDDCGRPYWEHAHVHGVGRDFGTLVPITPDDADRVRAKWGGDDE